MNFFLKKYRCKKKKKKLIDLISNLYHLILLDNFFFIMNEIKRLTGIYHETQEGSLCAQHALNNLLQREIFSAISLADIARYVE